jgi:hypothetical protein
MRKSRRQPALFFARVDNCPIAAVENGPFVLGPRSSARPYNACFGTRPRQQFVFRHARRRDDTRDTAGFFHSHPFVDSMSQKFYIARVSLHCKDMECAEGRTGVSASAATSRQLAQRNACDPDLSKSCNGVKGVSRGFASAEPLRGRVPSTETTRFLVGRSNRKQEPYGSKGRRTSRALSRAAAGLDDELFRSFDSRSADGKGDRQLCARRASQTHPAI